MEPVAKLQCIEQEVSKQLFHYLKTYTPQIYKQIWQYVNYSNPLPQLFAANKKRSTSKICDVKADSI